jgi:hypothetical protein
MLEEVPSRPHSRQRRPATRTCRSGVAAPHEQWTFGPARSDEAGASVIQAVWRTVGADAHLMLAPHRPLGQSRWGAGAPVNAPAEKVKIALSQDGR